MKEGDFLDEETICDLGENNFSGVNPSYMPCFQELAIRQENGDIKCGQSLLEEKA